MLVAPMSVVDILPCDFAPQLPPESLVALELILTECACPNGPSVVPAADWLQVSISCCCFSMLFYNVLVAVLMVFTVRRAQVAAFTQLPELKLVLERRSRQ